MDRIYRGASFSMGTFIDGYLTEEETKFLYDNWDASWPEPLAVSGNEKIITCEMVLEIEESVFTKHFPRGKRQMAADIYAAAKRNV